MPLYLGDKKIAGGSGLISAATIESETLKSLILDTIYPIGTIYCTTNNAFNPTDAWGGTWSALNSNTGEYRWNRIA